MFTLIVVGLFLNNDFIVPEVLLEQYDLTLDECNILGEEYPIPSEANSITWLCVESESYE